MVKKKKKKDNLEYVISYSLIIIMIVLALAFFIYQKNLIVEVNEIYVSANLTDSIGFDLNNTALTFGKVTKDNSVSREIVISNNYKDDILVEIRPFGKIKSHLYMAENNFLLKPLEKKELEVVLFFDESDEYGFYEGKIKIISRKT